MMNRRRIMLMQIVKQDELLPREYQRVEYIESSGTQWIDTGVSASIAHKLKWELDAQMLSSLEVNGCFFGSRSSSTRYYQFCHNAGVNGWITQSGGVTYKDVGQKNNDRNQFVYDVKNAIFTQNSTSYTVQQAQSVTDSTTVGLFARKDYGNVLSRQSSVRLWSFKVYENDVVIRDFIPCYRKSDNEIGVYDIVNDLFYTNQGTGEFLKGDDI